MLSHLAIALLLTGLPAATHAAGEPPAAETAAAATPAVAEPTANEEEVPPPALKPAPPLTPQELEKAARLDNLTIPGPGELLVALSKEAKPNWPGQYRQPIPTSYSSRAQIAMNIGGLIADGYIAVQAEDSQQVKNIGKDIITLAKSLAVSESVIARGNSIFEFAENNEWGALKEELEATQNEVKLALEEQRDGDLVWLVTLGGWLRGTEAVSRWINANYTPEAAKLLRQPAVVSLIRQRIDLLPERIKEDPVLKEVTARLPELETLVSFPEGATPSQDNVQALQELTTLLIARIITK